jgi:hypothetical protein
MTGLSSQPGLTHNAYLVTTSILLTRWIARGVVPIVVGVGCDELGGGGGG